ncbi:hypothetical protein ACXWTF_12930 [Thiomicrolovo sp. ZZH C-3]
MAATFQIYRNLKKKNHFSIRYKQGVIDWGTTLLLTDCNFHVGESGRLRVVERRRKGVHAWVVAKAYEKQDEINTDGMHELYYDPYFTQHFHSLKTGEVVGNADIVVCKNNRCFADGIS